MVSCFADGSVCSQRCTIYILSCFVSLFYLFCHHFLWQWHEYVLKLKSNTVYLYEKTALAYYACLQHGNGVVCALHVHDMYMISTHSSTSTLNVNHTSTLRTHLGELTQNVKCVPTLNVYIQANQHRMLTTRGFHLISNFYSFRLFCCNILEIVQFVLFQFFFFQEFASCNIRY